MSWSGGVSGQEGRGYNHNQMNSKRNIYELSRQIEQEEEDKAYEIEARKIANAYREVEQIKVTRHPLPPPKDEANKSKQPSTYAIKIKETLKEINANKAKMQQNVHRNIPHKVEEQARKAPSKLQRAGASKLFRVAEQYIQRMASVCFQSILLRGREEEKKEDIFIRKFRIFKIFRAWKQEIAIAKMQRKRNNQDDEMGSLKANELAKEFHAFVIIKKAFKGWNAEARKEIKRKRYEAELRKQEVAEKLRLKEEKKPPKIAIVPKNAQLQNKVRGFLDGLKEKIEHKDRLNTIKEKTEESEMRIKVTEHSHQQIRQHEESAEVEEDNEISSNQAMLGNSERNIQPEEATVEKKNLTNQELLKKRKELELKSKSRKQTLEKLRKEKEEKQKEEERKIAEIEKEIQLQQRRIKQEKYKQFVKNKQDQQQWEKREKQLEISAGQFNRYRLLKFYGWKPLSSLRLIKKKNGDQLYQTLLLILYRVKATTFMQSLQQTAQQSLQNQYTKMQKRYRLNLLRKSFQAFNKCYQEESQKKVEYAIMHQVNTLKIYYSSWKRLIPQLTVENFEWQRPRNKRANEFHRIQLLHKAFSSLQTHKIESQRAKNIASHKTRIQNKLKSLLEDEETMNYQQFL